MTDRPPKKKPFAPTLNEAILNGRLDESDFGMARAALTAAFTALTASD